MPTGRSATARRHRVWAIGICVCLLMVLPLAARRGGAVTPPQARLAPGDPAKGRALVESSRCLDCHRVGDEGSRLGPDLSEIGRLRSPDSLRRALLAPDEDVLPEHRFIRIVTKDGASVESGVLTTASDVLFSGGREGHFFALDARNGELLWKVNLGGTVASGPITNAVDGHQYVAVSADTALYVFGLPVQN